jgi:hypothetical protein
METDRTPPTFAGPTSFAGRGGELVLLLNRFMAVAEGHAHVVLVVGEPGIGKTRLRGSIMPEGIVSQGRNMEHLVSD